MKLYSKQGLWALFLICAFPLHVWTIILAFRDFSWVAARTNSWDAIGVISYSLIFALIESVFVFLVVLLLSFLVSRKWSEERRLTLVGSLAFLTSLWAMAGYLFFILNVGVSAGTTTFLSGMAHPLRFLYGLSLVLVFLTIAIPVYLLLRSDKVLKGVQVFFDRLSLLTQLYLFFDLVGFVIVVIRNLV